MLSSIPHIQSLRSALQKEYEFEKNYFQQQKEAIGLRRLISRGECWYPITTGTVGYNSLGELTIEIYREESSGGVASDRRGNDYRNPISPVLQANNVNVSDIAFATNTGNVNKTSDDLSLRTIDTKFEPQTSVVFFRTTQDGHLNYFKWNGTVSYQDGNRMVIVVPRNGQITDVVGQSNPVKQYNGDFIPDALGIQIAFNERTYQLEFEALNKVEKSTQESFIHLREVLIGGERPSFSNHSKIGFSWLNLSQEEAVNRLLDAKDVMIVHGPPGTGKTTTLLEAIYETLRREPQVLVCAQSNAAVDWISSQLMDRGVPILRIGNPTRVTDKMLQSTYERQFADHPRYPDLWTLRKILREGHGSKGKLGHEERDRLREKVSVLEMEIRQTLFQNAKVIACTLAGAGHPLMHGQQFNTVFIDEAAQATEPACWIAIRRARRVIMAGDHCQLPPTLKSPDAARGPLGRTLMEHVALSKPEAVSLLTMQYRMHPDIMQFSSDYFYDGKLTAAESVKYRGALDFDSALIWFDTSDSEWQEAEQHDGTSRYNVEEARFLVTQLEEYADMLTIRRLQDDGVDFAVISPYQAQIHLLRRLIKRSQKLRQLRKHITVETVDAFQGQERDVVIISLVRANESGQIGFLQDLRRMNVALTRARHKVMIIGDSKTLCRHKFYKQLYEHTERVGRVVAISSEQKQTIEAVEAEDKGR